MDDVRFGSPLIVVLEIEFAMIGLISMIYNEFSNILGNIIGENNLNKE